MNKYQCLALAACVMLAILALSSCGKKSVKASEYKMLYSDASPARVGHNANEKLMREQADTYITGVLDWELTHANSGADIIAAVKARPLTIFYYRGHGAGAGGRLYVFGDRDENDGKFLGMWIDSSLVSGASLTPAFNTYTFVFINACWSGLQPGASEIQKALTGDKEGAVQTTYLGWEGKLTGDGSGYFASYFYEYCNGGVTVNEAARNAQAKVASDYSVLWLLNTSYIILGNSSITIDTTP